ncbi:DUF1929 domain-containing protein [filamentous cyanobacterium LEGE 11480]|uniref:DUF1929 domain-containing protein n=1 Tax=Romeriopsis navalis LEGE 11480 TaxID=2777977 RepID=A0A928VQG5_9CYAN|nr:galactose oxidase-like domain-containing protein [Romeriopsis navalis]MBE9030234.1 DUF1929 domain-containing protein [Romeriopsis navalis LEGE 11480]
MMLRFPNRSAWLGLTVVCTAVLALGHADRAEGMAGMLDEEEQLGNMKPPIDLGPTPAEADRLLLPAEEAAPSDAHIKGKWSRVGGWPIVPIHAVLLPNGKVLSYGTNPAADNGTGFFYDVWNPAQGLRRKSHLTLPTITDTNIFCSGQVLLPSGQVLITGGSQEINGVRNFGIATAQLFNPSDNSLRRLPQSMNLSRWYPAVTTLGNGTVLLQGGRDEKKKSVLTPEIYNPKTQKWKLLTGATNSEIYQNGWWYPKSYVMPGGKVLVLPRGKNQMWALNPRGTGSWEKLGQLPGPNLSSSAPAVMYDTNKILVIQGVQQASTIDIRGGVPKVAATGGLSQPRHWANATALPNGEVLLVGGASKNQKEENAVNYTEMWNPNTGQWTPGATAQKSRLYHSTALLLPDGRVLIGGGGPPGPVVNQNAEIYSPPYLFKPDGSGKRAARPKIVTPIAGARYGQTVNVNFSNAQKISRVTLIRTGSVTHSFNMDERMRRLPFTQQGKQLRIRFPKGRNVTPPGHYMLFLVNDQGVPSKSRIIKLR